MNRFLAMIAFAALIMSCKGKESETQDPAPEPVTDVAFARGADISWASEMEAGGITFTDSNGSEGLLATLKNLGMNSIRLRVWVNPYDSKGWSGQADVVKMAVRAMEAGMAVMIDFHYSDFFADPARQNMPSAWSSYSSDVTKVASAVASHTSAVLSALKSSGVVPAWVQVGNETNNGMVWNAGKIDWTSKSGSARYADYVTVSNAGYNAVKEVFPDTPVIVHIADAFSAGNYEGWFFKEFKEAGGKFDMIGLSHYPMNQNGKSWSEMNSLAVSSIKTLASKLSCKVMICETGVTKSSSEAASCMTAFMQLAKGLGQNVCAGVFYWEPEVDGKWKPAIYSQSGLECNGWSAYAQGAFNSYGTTFTPDTSILSSFSE